MYAKFLFQITFQNQLIQLSTSNVDVPIYNPNYQCTDRNNQIQHIFKNEDRLRFVQLEFTAKTGMFYNRPRLWQAPYSNHSVSPFIRKNVTLVTTFDW
jgi:hypothetical protein